MMRSNQWLKTPEAAVALAVSQGHLKRCRDIKGGFLIGGEHYVMGSSQTASIQWNVDEIRKAFHNRGLQVRGIDNHKKEEAPKYQVEFNSTELDLLYEVVRQVRNEHDPDWQPEPGSWGHAICQLDIKLTEMFHKRRR
jgi:hypothetical protein